jgi:hypothetical protein
MPATLAQLDALKSAYRSGQLTVQYEGKSVTMRSMEEMRAAIASLEAELGMQGVGKSIRVITDKGW